VGFLGGGEKLCCQQHYGGMGRQWTSSLYAKDGERDPICFSSEHCVSRSRATLYNCIHPGFSAALGFRGTGVPVFFNHRSSIKLCLDNALWHRDGVGHCPERKRVHGVTVLFVAVCDPAGLCCSLQQAYGAGCAIPCSRISS
jgi:hypothetical protein